MALTTCTVTTNNIATVGTNVAERGLTTDQFKALFDKYGVDFVTYFNNTHLVELANVANVPVAYAADAGATDDYTVTITGITAYTIGTPITFKANTTNNSPPTLNVNSLGAKTVKTIDGNNVTDGMITAGQIVVVAYDGTNFRMLSHPASVPMVKVTHSASQSIANGTYVPLAFNTESYDTDTIHDTVTNNTRLTCKTPGKYRITGQVRFAINATGNRIAAIVLNGATYIALANFTAISGIETMVSAVADYQLSAGDYVELQAYQTSGGALAVDPVTYSPIFGMYKVG